MPRKEGRRGLVNIEDSVNARTGQLEDCIKKSKERLITPTRNNLNNTRINTRTITRKKKLGKNNCMDISSDKQAKSHTRRPGHG